MEGSRNKAGISIELKGSCTLLLYMADKKRNHGVTTTSFKLFFIDVFVFLAVLCMDNTCDIQRNIQFSNLGGELPKPVDVHIILTLSYFDHVPHPQLLKLVLSQHQNI
jgi:ABC-type uncharacterized transport system permease subunit